MLQRQQAGAISPRASGIVEGAVGMVEMALERLASQKISTSTASESGDGQHLLVVLCSERAAQPVVNTGTLYQ